MVQDITCRINIDTTQQTKRMGPRMLDRAVPTLLPLPLKCKPLPLRQLPVHSHNTIGLFTGQSDPHEDRSTLPHKTVFATALPLRVRLNIRRADRCATHEDSSCFTNGSAGLFKAVLGVLDRNPSCHRSHLEILCCALIEISTHCEHCRGCRPK